jgi:hypothetical protein
MPGRSAATCRADADDDLREQDLAEMVKCIRLCLDCVDVCTATAGVISRQTDYDADSTRPLLEACMASCKSCGDEYEGACAASRAVPGLRAGLPRVPGYPEIGTGHSAGAPVIAARGG